MLNSVKSIPTYTSDESRVKLKLQYDNTVTDFDFSVIKSDIKSKFFRTLTSSPDESEVIDYLNQKYPKWDSKWKLIELI